MRAVEASLAVRHAETDDTTVRPTAATSVTSTGTCRGAVAGAFRKRLVVGNEVDGHIEGHADATVTTTATTGEPSERGSSSAIGDKRPRKRPHATTSTSKPDQAASSSSCAGSKGDVRDVRPTAEVGPTMVQPSGDRVSTSNKPSPKRKKRGSSCASAPVASGPPAEPLDEANVQQALVHLAAADARLGAVIAQIGPPTALLDKLPQRSLAPSGSGSSSGESSGDASATTPGPVSVSWRALTKAIVYQQLSTLVAQKIFQRLIDVCVEFGGAGDDNTTIFSPRALLAVPEVKLLSPKQTGGEGVVGLSRRKAEYVRELAQKFDSGDLTDAMLASLDDATVMRALLEVRGLGEWSVHMFLMFGLGRPDVLPVGDLAVQKAFKKLYATNRSATGATQVNELPTRREMEEIAESWRPWRTVGSWYMWHVVETAACNWV